MALSLLCNRLSTRNNCWNVSFDVGDVAVCTVRGGLFLDLCENWVTHDGFKRADSWFGLCLGEWFGGQSALNGNSAVFHVSYYIPNNILSSDSTVH